MNHKQALFDKMLETKVCEHNITIGEWIDRLDPDGKADKCLRFEMARLLIETNGMSYKQLVEDLNDNLSSN